MLTRRKDGSIATVSNLPIPCRSILNKWTIVQDRRKIALHRKIKRISHEHKISEYVALLGDIVMDRSSRITATWIDKNKKTNGSCCDWLSRKPKCITVARCKLS